MLYNHLVLWAIPATYPSVWHKEGYLGTSYLYTFETTPLNHLDTSTPLILMKHDSNLRIVATKIGIRYENITWEQEHKQQRNVSAGEWSSNLRLVGDPKGKEKQSFGTIAQCSPTNIFVSEQVLLNLFRPAFGCASGNWKLWIDIVY